MDHSQETSNDPVMMKNSSETVKVPDYTFRFLSIQIEYMNSHLQLADAKAAGIIAFSIAVTGVTATQLDELRPLGLISTLVSAFAILASLLAIWPRSWFGQDSADRFSWVGLASEAKSNRHVKSILKLSEQEILEAMADTAEVCSLVIRRKYQLIQISMGLLAFSTFFHVLTWIMI